MIVSTDLGIEAILWGLSFGFKWWLHLWASIQQNQFGDSAIEVCEHAKRVGTEFCDRDVIIP